MLISVIIINYNYARYVEQAIQSCLNQTYAHFEVIVVDDGSNDGSRKVIDQYENEIIKVYQENSGMMAASHNGLNKSKGEVVIFLDADDYLLNNTIEEVAAVWKEGLSSVYYRVQKVDNDGQAMGTIPSDKEVLKSGELWKEIVNTGTCTTPPTSGNAFARRVLEEIYPITDARINDSGTYFDVIPTDSYLKLRTPFYGPVIFLDKVLAAKRIHGKNNKGKSPYLNVLKRHRHLKLAQLNSKFIDNQLRNKNLKWNEARLFKKNKLIRIRMISLRFDGEKHPWPSDTRFSIIGLYFKNSAASDLKNPVQWVHNFVILTLIGFINKAKVIRLLETNARLNKREL